MQLNLRDFRDCITIVDGRSDSHHRKRHDKLYLVLEISAPLMGWRRYPDP